MLMEILCLISKQRSLFLSVLVLSDKRRVMSDIWPGMSDILKFMSVKILSLSDICKIVSDIKV